MIEAIQSALEKLAAIERLKADIGAALTEDAQIEISKKLKADKNAFNVWVKTTEGQMAVRDLAGKFLTAK